MSSKEISKWADTSMFTAEESKASDGPKVYLLGGPADPLGQIAACAKMYKGEVVRDLADVTDAERHEYLEEIQKTVLKMPLEAVSLHFMVEGVTRGFTHQMVRQRTAAFAQESTRFAVKEDMKTATALPPSLEGTLSLDELVEKDIFDRRTLGLTVPDRDVRIDSMGRDWYEIHRRGVSSEAIAKNDVQAARLRWDEAVDAMGNAYMNLVNSGMPAEDARGLLPTNITTRLNYITNLRSFYDTMAVRVSDQAQFEWRGVAMQMALAMREYGENQTYRVRRTNGVGHWSLSSAWQYEALTNEIKPIEFKIGKRAFGANFDRPSRIGERVDEFARCGVPSSEWTKGSAEYGIPPIHPEEWLLDPNSARLARGMEFDVFGNRVPEGTGWHFSEAARHGGGRLMTQHYKSADGEDMVRHAIWSEDFAG
jgi:thymidylate synthase ThyX